MWVGKEGDSPNLLQPLYNILLGRAAEHDRNPIEVGVPTLQPDSQTRFLPATK